MPVLRKTRQVINGKLLKTRISEKPTLKLFKQTLKTTFINRRFLVFIVIFILVNIFLYIKYADALKDFAFLEKNFTVVEVVAQQIAPVDLLAKEFTCGTKEVISACNYLFLVLILIFILLEGFAIHTTIKNRKLVSKKTLAVYFVSLQVLFIIPIIALVGAPYRAIFILQQQANRDIQRAVERFNSGYIEEKGQIKTDLNEIRNEMISNRELPTLIEENSKEQFILQTLYIGLNEKDSLYRVSIIPYEVYLSSKIAPLKSKLKKELALFPSNILVISEINPKIIKEITAPLAEKIIEEQYSQYVEKQKPIIDVPEEKDYLTIRQKENKKIQQDYINYFESIKNNIAENRLALSQNEANIIEINKEYERYKAYGDEWVANCKRDFGEGSADCKNGATTIVSNLQGLIESRNQNEEANRLARAYINEAQEMYSITQKRQEEFLRSPVIPEGEAGVFVFPNSIHIKYVAEKPAKFSSYLATVIHEYLHYLSSHQVEDFSSFLNEGVTDYITGNLIKNFLKLENVDGYLGYPKEVEIITSLADKIPEDELVEVYFSKNESKLRSRFNNTFKDITYSDFISKSEEVFYTNLNDQALKTTLTKNVVDSLSGK